MNNLVNILLVEDDEVDIMNVKRAFKKNNIHNPDGRASWFLMLFRMLKHKIK